MGNLKNRIVNSFNIVAGKNATSMVKISWGGYTYKRIGNREEIKDNRYYRANLYVDSA